MKFHTACFRIPNVNIAMLFDMVQPDGENIVDCDIHGFEAWVCCRSKWLRYMSEFFTMVSYKQTMHASFRVTGK